MDVKTGGTLPALLDSTAVRLALGGTIFYGVLKLSREIEEKLTDTAKSDVANWLLGMNIESRLEPVPDVIGLMFNHAFGDLTNHSFRRVCRVAIASAWAVVCLQSIHSGLDVAFRDGFGYEYWIWLLSFTIGCTISNYISLPGALRWTELLRKRSKVIALVNFLPVDSRSNYKLPSLRRLATLELVSAINALLTAFGIALAVFYLVIKATEANANLLVYLYIRFVKPWRWPYAALLPWLCISVYLLAGFILKLGRRIDIGFRWFNSKFDIRNKPLQSIGLIAAILATSIYWALVVVSKFW